MQLSYRLSRHYIGSFSAGVWIVVIGFLIALLGLIPRIAISPVVMIFAGICGLLTLALLLWGKAASYCYFRPHERTPGLPSDGLPMSGLEKVDTRVTGRFSVEGKERFFADIHAIYHSFESREHAIMAHVPPTRFAWLAQSRKEDIGMWYRFIAPDSLEAVEAGELARGSQRMPALRITYRGEKRSEDIYLAFENEAEQARVMADLRYDSAPGEGV